MNPLFLRLFLHYQEAIYGTRARSSVKQHTFALGKCQ